MSLDYSKYPTKPKDEIIIAMPSNEVWIIPILKYFDGISVDYLLVIKGMLGDNFLSKSDINKEFLKLLTTAPLFAQFTHGYCANNNMYIEWEHDNNTVIKMKIGVYVDLDQEVEGPTAFEGYYNDLKKFLRKGLQEN